MLESKIEKAVVQWAEERGWVTYKLSGLGNKGKADRVFLHSDIVLFLEFKRTGKKTGTKLQQWHRRRLMKIGFETHFVDSVEQGISILKNRSVV